MALTSAWERGQAVEKAIFTETKKHELVINYSKDESIADSNTVYRAMILMPDKTLITEEVSRPSYGNNCEQVDTDIFNCLGRWVKARIAERYEGKFDG